MKQTLAIITLASSALLTACGGGGGSTSTNQGDTTPEDVQAFNYLNAERSRCGFGTLTRKTTLDAAASAHADWMHHAGVLSHDEDQSMFPVGFTGNTAYDRALAQDAYNLRDGFDVYEALAVQSGLGKAGEGVYSLRRLLNAPYHAIGLLDGYRDIGVAVRHSSDVGLSGNVTYTAYVPGASRSVGKQVLASDAVLTYPCEGSAGMANKLSNETPNPVPGRDLSTNPLGVTVLVKVADGQALAITSASMVELATGNAVPLRAHVGGANGLADPINDYNASNVFISADVAMTPFSQYKAVITGTNNGVAFRREFVFSTGTSL